MVLITKGQFVSTQNDFSIYIIKNTEKNILKIISKIVYHNELKILLKKYKYIYKNLY